jgi:microcystin-dependent protein
MFPFNFAPKGWAQCNGQLLPISQNTALFSLLGTFYGGDGKSTFALPDLQDSVAIHQGQGQGLSSYSLGQQAGTETVTLLQSEIPVHTHSFSQSVRPSDNLDPAALALGTGNNIYAAPSGSLTAAPEALAPAGSSFPHNNMMPYLAVNFCIAMQGAFPARN